MDSKSTSAQFCDKLGRRPSHNDHNRRRSVREYARLLRSLMDTPELPVVAKEMKLKRQRLFCWLGQGSCPRAMIY